MKKINFNTARKAFIRYLFFKRSEKWNTIRIKRYQDSLLKKLINHAGKNVPYYRNLFEEIGFDPNLFRGRIDMQEIPILDKEAIRKNKNELIAENAIQYGINWDSTSGSTGTPLEIIIDNKTRANKYAVDARNTNWAGYSLLYWKKSFNIERLFIKSDDPLFQNNYNIIRYDSNKVTEKLVPTLINKMNNIRPKVLFGHAFPLILLGRYAEEMNIQIKPVGAVITAGETLSKRRRKLLETIYKCEVFDYYASHECSTIIAECEYHSRHLIEDFSYSEIINNKNINGNVSEGTLVGTCLYNYAMPLIRYNTEDIVSTKKNEQYCKCGRQFQIINNILGRQNDYLITPEGKKIGNVLEHSIDGAKGVALSQIVQESINHIYINLIVDEDFSHESFKSIEKELRKRLESEISIDYNIVNQLEQNRGGKTPFVLSKIGNEYF